MESFRAHDYFAPIIAHPVSTDLRAIAWTFPPVTALTVLSIQSSRSGLSSLDRADRFTYIIMGLAVLIAIVIPLLNLCP